MRLLWLPLFLLIAACDSASPSDPEAVVLDSARLLERVSKEEIAGLGFPVDAEYDVDLYALTYHTLDAAGAVTIASGALAVPAGARTNVPLVSYQHGTEVLKDGVASVGGMETGETLVAVIFAASGYLAAMPDYLGLGVSPGLHPYVHSETLGSASVDMLRAAREQARALDMDLSGEVFLIGYSEGGNATVAAQRQIEERWSLEFDLVASAPMAGAYDLSGVMVSVMRSEDPYPAPYYLPYLLLAYNEIYSLFPSASDLFDPPYDVILPGLFDGTHGAGEINDAMPGAPIAAARGTFVDAFDADPNHPLRAALRENDLYTWAPSVPTRIYHCVEDDLIPFANAQKAFDEFTARGAPDVSLQPLNYGGHVDCVGPALLLGKFWFDALRLAQKADPAPEWTAAERAAWPRLLD